MFAEHSFVYPIINLEAAEELTDFGRRSAVLVSILTRASRKFAIVKKSEENTHEMCSYHLSAVLLYVN